MAIKIFLSATFGDLRDERLEVLEIFRRLRVINSLNVELITMEDFGFSDQKPIEKCLELLEKADAYLGLLSYKYGSIPSNGKLSYTEREYRHAAKLKLPIYFLEKTGQISSNDIETDPLKLQKLTDLRNHIKKNHLTMQFRDRLELGKVLLQYLPSNLYSNFEPQKLSLTTKSDSSLFLQLKEAPIFTQKISNPSSLSIVSINCSNFLKDRSSIEKYLEINCDIKIMIIKKNGNAELMYKNFTNKKGVLMDNDIVCNRYLYYQDLIMKNKWKGKIEIREIYWFPSTSIFMVDSETKSPILWLGFYTPDILTPGGDKWVIELSNSSNLPMLEFYKKQFYNLWQTATPLICPH